MSPVTIPAVEWFFGQQDASIGSSTGSWCVSVFNGDEYAFSRYGPDPIELIEAAYEKLYAEPARREIREEEK